MRKQIREIRIVDLITYTFLPPIVIACLWIFGPKLIGITPIRPWIIYVVFVIMTYFLFKRFVIGIVVAYKAFAPLSVRDKCRFEPTCSTYMIMAINKYGLVWGVIKGVKRLLRCKPPNGGVDYP